MSTIIKSLSLDFPSGLYSFGLQNLINSDPGFTSHVINIETYGDVISIIFNGTLTLSETNLLDSIISSYVMIPPQGDSSFVLLNSYDYHTSLTYQTIGTTIYPGSNIYKNPTNIKIVSHMQPGGSGYNVRIYDSLNNQVITEITGLTDETPTIVNLDTLMNIPSTESIFEVQVSTELLTNANVGSAILYYN